MHALGECSMIAEPYNGSSKDTDHELRAIAVSWRGGINSG